MEENREPRQADDTTAVGDEERSVSQENDEMEALREKAGENWELFLRARADLDNYRKRSQKEIALRVKQGKRGLLLGMLAVVDNLERAVSQGEGSPFLEGVKIVQRQMLDLLASEGVSPVDSLGKPFDPAFHECVAFNESADVEEETITEELQKGYTYGDELLRPARVQVTRPPQ